MTSVAPITPPVVPAGTDRVNSAALDGVIGQIVARTNQLIAAVAIMRQANDRFADGTVEWRMFSDTCIGAIREILTVLHQVRAQYTDNWIPLLAATDAEVAASSRYLLDPLADFFDGVPPADAGMQQALTVGETGRIYEVSVRLRSFARGYPVITDPPQAGADLANRLFYGAPATPDQESVGVEVSDPALRILTNAAEVPPPLAPLEYAIGLIGEDASTYASADGLTWAKVGVSAQLGGITPSSAGWHGERLIVANDVRNILRYDAVSAATFGAAVSHAPAATWNASAFPRFSPAGFGSAVQPAITLQRFTHGAAPTTLWSEALGRLLLACSGDASGGGVGGHGQLWEFDEATNTATPVWYFCTQNGGASSLGGIIPLVHENGAYGILVPNSFNAPFFNVIAAAAPGGWALVPGNNMGAVQTHPGGGVSTYLVSAACSDNGQHIAVIYQDGGDPTKSILTRSSDFGVTWVSSVFYTKVGFTSSENRGLVWNGTVFIWTLLTYLAGSGGLEMHSITTAGVRTLIGFVPFDVYDAGVYGQSRGGPLMHSRRRSETIATICYTRGGNDYVRGLRLSDASSVPSAITERLLGVTTAAFSATKVRGACLSSELGNV